MQTGIRAIASYLLNHQYNIDVMNMDEVDAGIIECLAEHRLLYDPDEDKLYLAMEN